MRFVDVDIVVVLAIAVLCFVALLICVALVFRDRGKW